MTNNNEDHGVVGHVKWLGHEVPLIELDPSTILMFWLDAKEIQNQSGHDREQLGG